MFRSDTSRPEDYDHHASTRGARVTTIVEGLREAE
jgi:hypothetical protein